MSNYYQWSRALISNYFLKILLSTGNKILKFLQVHKEHSIKFPINEIQTNQDTQARHAETESRNFNKEQASQLTGLNLVMVLDTYATGLFKIIRSAVRSSSRLLLIGIIQRHGARRRWIMSRRSRRQRRGRLEMVMLELLFPI